MGIELVLPACSQMIEGIATKEELHDMCRLLDFLAAELAANSNFEFLQALLRLTLQVRPIAFCCMHTYMFATLCIDLCQLGRLFAGASKVLCVNVGVYPLDSKRVACWVENRYMGMPS